jgi:uncharacterized protein YunC (DUF1805 family)
LINVNVVKVSDKRFLGVRVEFPDSPPLVLIVGRKASSCVVS